MNKILSLPSPRPLSGASVLNDDYVDVFRMAVRRRHTQIYLLYYIYIGTRIAFYVTCCWQKSISYCIYLYRVSIYNLDTNRLFWTKQLSCAEIH